MSLTCRLLLLPVQSSSSPVPLPAWSTGSRFYVLGSVLTRDMYEDRLFVDVMVMGRKIFDGTLGDATGVKGLDDRSVLHTIMHSGGGADGRGY